MVKVIHLFFRTVSLTALALAMIVIACGRPSTDVPPLHVPDGAYDRTGQTDTLYLHVIVLTDGKWEHVSVVSIPRDTLVDTYTMPDIREKSWRLVVTNLQTWPTE